VVFAALQNDILRRRSEKGEVIFVDDGSGDNSFQLLKSFFQQHPDIVRVVKLSRNFGQQFAVLAGLRHARGRCAVTMSADGQEPTSLFNEMLDKFFAGGVEIVAGRRITREDSVARRLSSRLAYGIMRRLAFPTVPRDGFDMALMSRKALTVFLDNVDATYFGQGILMWMGFPIHYVDYARQDRVAGRSRYTLAKLVNYLMDGVVGYSFFPIRFLSYLGLVVALCGFAYTGWLVVANLIWDTPVLGWSSIIVSILVGSGLQMLMLGMIGEYMWRILANVRNRSPYVIEAILKKD
jgi:dolichol-phosphate mannosyltransferase